MKVNRGDIISSEFGTGTIVAITKEWIILDVKGEEFACHKKETALWLPIEAKEDAGSIDCSDWERK